MLETKANLNDTTMDTLQDLIGTNADCSEFFGEAAQLCSNPTLTPLLQEVSERERSFAMSLSQFVAWNGEEPQDDESLRARMRRWWLRFVVMLPAGDDHAILMEAAAGHALVLERYETLLMERPSLPVRPLLERQCAKVKLTQEKLEALREAYAPLMV